MTDKNHGPALAANLFHLRLAFLLKLGIADRHHLVENKYVRFEMSGDGESQPQVHAARVVFDRNIQKLFDSGEGHDLVKLILDLALLHSDDCAVQKNIFPAGQVRMKTCAYFEQAARTSVHVNLARGRFYNSGENLQEG